MLLVFPFALADDTVLAACCKAGGSASCPKEIVVRTEKSATDTIGLGWEVMGAWRQSCSSGGKFDPNIEVDADAEPEFGEVLTTELTPLAAHCFSQACALPSGVCLSAANSAGHFSLVSCDDALPVDQKQLAAAPGKSAPSGSRVVMLDGKPLVAAPIRVDAPVAAYVPAESPWGASTGSGVAPSQPVWSAAATPTWGATSAVAPVYPAATPSYSAPPAAPKALALPDDPPDPCSPAPDAVRAESRRRVGSGDDLRIVGKADEALGDYRAALTMDKCNGYAWMSIAQLASDQSRTDLTIRALRNATRLLPAHPGAFLMLGKALESFGQARAASDAYKRAQELAPSNAEAVEGYMRTRG